MRRFQTTGGGLTTLRKTFGEELRRWRTKRGRAQLELGLRAGYSQRHISFLERGRSQPSRTTVLDLAEALEIPLADRNALLQSAGYAPIFTAEPLDGDRLRLAVESFEEILKSHRPFLAFVVDRAWSLYASNENGLAFFGRMLDRPLSFDVEAPPNILQLCLSPEGLRPRIRNWPSFARNMLSHLKRDLDFDGTNERLQSLIAQLESDPELSAHEPSEAWPASDPFSLVELEGIPGLGAGARLRMFSMTSQFGNPLDSTLSELRIETFLPADGATRAALVALDAEVETERARHGDAAVHRPVTWLRS